MRGAPSQAFHSDALNRARERSRYAIQAWFLFLYRVALKREGYKPFFLDIVNLIEWPAICDATIIYKYCVYK